MNDRAIFWDMHLKPGTIRYGFEIIKWHRQIFSNTGAALGEYLVKCLTCLAESYNTINMLTSKCKICKANDKLLKQPIIPKSSGRVVIRQKHLKPGAIRFNVEVIKWEKQLIKNGRCCSLYLVKCLTCDDEYYATAPEFKKKCVNCRVNDKPISISSVVECLRCKFQDNPESFKNLICEKLKVIDPLSAAILQKCRLGFYDFGSLTIDIQDLSSNFGDYLLNNKASLEAIVKEISGNEYRITIGYYRDFSDKTVADRFE